MPGYLSVCCAAICLCAYTTKCYALMPQISFAESDSLILIGAGLAAVAALMNRKKGGK